MSDDIEFKPKISYRVGQVYIDHTFMAATFPDMVIQHKDSKPKWEPYYAWVPKRVGKKWFWRSIIYRKFVLSPGGGFYKYGTEFDMLKDVE